MVLKVAKFGGTSVATAEQLRKVARIIEGDANRRAIVPSAPGKAHPEDTKVTDLLLLAHDMAHQGQDISGVWENIAKRFRDIISDLALDLDLEPQLAQTKQVIVDGASRDYAASRGEALHGHIVAALLHATYIDAADVVRIKADGRLDTASYDLINAACQGLERVVIPGFYGKGPDDKVRCFSRGGSDITGAVVARALNADAYENWTDVSGVLMTDPRVVPEAPTINELTYAELRELSYMGASVLHEEAVFPCRSAGIPIAIRNTYDPEASGTRIVASRDTKDQIVTGIAGKPGFTTFYLEKAMMNGELGFGRRVLDVFERLGISYEHTPSGIDTMSIVVEDQSLGARTEQVVADLQGAVHPDNIDVFGGMALIATVGQGMNRRVGTAAKLFTALAEAQVNIRMIDQGSSEQNIIVGVENADRERAIRAIYDAFSP